MFFALVGAITVLLMLTRWRDPQIREM